MNKTHWVKLESALKDLSNTPKSKWNLSLASTLGDDEELFLLARRLVELSPQQGRPAAAWVCSGWQPLCQFASHGPIQRYLVERIDGGFKDLALFHTREHPLADGAALQQFQAEFRTLEALYDNSIGRILDAGLDEWNRPFLVSEIVGGISIVAAARDLDSKGIAGVFAEVLASLEHAHNRQAWHGSLHPTNILLGTNKRVRLADYGCQRLLFPDGISPAKGQWDSVSMDCLLYLAPEQIRSAPAYPSSDIYAMGVLLYHLLAGVTPYGHKEESALELAASICDKTPARIEGLDPQLDQILQRALAKDPQSRYPTISSFRQDIEQYLKGRPLSPNTAAAKRPMGLQAQFRHFVQTQYVSMILILLTGVVLVVAFLSVFSPTSGSAASNPVQSKLESAAKALSGDRTPPKGETAMQSSRKHLDQLFEESGHKPEVRQSLAQAYLGLAEAEMRGFGTPGVDHEAARQASERAYQLTASALNTSKDANENDKAVIAYARSARQLTQILRTSRNYEEAFRVTEEWQARMEKISSSNPEVLRSKALANTTMADILYEAGLTKPSLDVALSAMAQYEQAYVADPKNPAGAQAYAQAAYSVGMKSLVLDQNPAALNALTTSEKLLRKQVESASPATAPLLEFAKTLDGLGQALERSSQRTKALSSYRESRRILLQARQREQGSEAVTYALADNYLQSARFYSEGHEADLAWQEANAALELLNTSPQALNAHPERHKLLARALSLKASVLLARKQKPAAMELLASSQSHWEQYSRSKNLVGTEVAELAHVRAMIGIQ